MRICLLGVAAGLATLSLARLPLIDLWLLLPLALLLGVLLLRSQGPSRLLLGFVVAGLVGYAWGVHTIAGLLAARLTPCVQDATQSVLAEVLEDPSPLYGPVANSLRLQVRVLDQRRPDCGDLRGKRLRLSWYGAPEILGGQQWWLDARLQAARGYRNPGGFDYARWMLGRRLQGSGYVRAGQRFAIAEPGPAQRLRRALRRELAASSSPGGAIVYALITGDGAVIQPATWDVLRTTGTVHLMVVSGLHVGLVAALAYSSGALLVRAVPLLLLWVPAHWAGTVAALLGAGSYVLFTGSGVPGSRAWLMAALFMAARLVGRQVRAGQALLLAFVGVLAMNPAAVHQQGLWLSFAAVAALLLFFRGRVQAVGSGRSVVQAQLALAVGLTPCLALVTGHIPMLGPLANLFAVPLVTLVVLPASLVSAGVYALLPDLGRIGLEAVAWLLDVGVGVLTWLASGRSLIVSPGFWLGAGALAAGVALLRGLAPRPRCVVVLVWLAWLTEQRLQVAEGEFRVQALDVGQGSAIVVDTRRHRLLFDAGPGFPSGFNLGASVVVPSLLATGPARLDALVLSHPDLDHTGGAAAVVAALPIGTTYAGDASAAIQPCRRGLSWSWDGVEFEFLNPYSTRHGVADNDRSCVLRVAGASGSALLAGDISAVVERELARTLPPVDLMFAPHHGSRSSSTKAFVRLLRPRVVFVSAGYRNRFGHPHALVLRRYQEIGARVYVTAVDGALLWRSRFPDRVQTLRDPQTIPYWSWPGGSATGR